MNEREHLRKENWKMDNLNKQLKDGIQKLREENKELNTENKQLKEENQKLREEREQQKGEIKKRLLRTKQLIQIFLRLTTATRKIKPIARKG